MAVGSEYLVAVVGADVTQFRKSMRDVRNELGILAHEGTGLKDTFRAVGEAMTYALSAPIAILGAGAVTAASSFESAMRNINSVAFLTESQFNTLGNEVFEFGKTTREGADAAAKALYTIYSAGLSGETALDLMKVTSHVAEAGLADLSSTAEGLTSIMLAYGLTTEEEAKRAGDALTRMVQVGVGDMQTFVGTIAGFMPSAAALGVDYQEAFALDAILTQLGNSPAEAATRVNAAMRSMIKPSEAMKAVFTELGVKTTKELIAKFGGLAEALIAIRGASDGTEEAIGAIFGDSRAIQGVLSLTKDIDRTRQAIVDFNAEAEGATDRARWQQMQSLSYMWDAMTASMQAAAMVLGNVLLPIVKPMVEGLRSFFLRLTELDKTSLGFVVTIGAVVAAIGPMVWLFSSLLSPIALTAGAVVALLNAISQVPNVANAATNMLKDMADALGPIYNKITALVEKLFNSDFGNVNTADAVQTYATNMTTAVNGWTHEVESGDTLWDIWYDNFLGKMTWEDFIKQSGFEGKPTVIKPGDMIIIKKMSSASLMPFSSSGGRDGIRENWWQALMGGLEDIGSDIGTELEILRPKIDKAFGSFLFSIGSSIGLASDSMGATPVYNFIKGIIDSFMNIGSSLNEAMPETVKGFSDFFEGVFSWVATEAIPTASRTAGLIVGTLARVLSQALTGLFNWISSGGVGDAGQAASTFVDDSIIAPFSAGLSDGLGDSATLGAGLSGAFSNLSTFLGAELSRILPEVTTKLTEFFRAISDYLIGQNTDTNGNTALYTSVRGAFTYLFDGGLSGDISEQAPAIQDAFLGMLSSVGEWLMTNGVETIARGVGYLAGRVGVLIGQAFGQIGGGGDSMERGLTDHVIDPLMGGFNDAFKDAGVADMDIGSKILTAIAGSIALAAVASMGIWGAASAAIWGALSLAIYAASWMFSFNGYTIAKTIIMGIANSMATGGAVSGIATGVGGAFTAGMATVSATTSWIVAGATSIITALGSAIATVGATMLPLASLLFVSGSTGPLPTLPEQDMPIKVNLFPDYTLATTLPMQGSGMGGLGGEVGSALGALMQANMGNSIVITELPATVGKIKLTGTPDEIQVAENFWPTSDLNRLLGESNIQVGFSDLFEVVPSEGFELSDYIIPPATMITYQGMMTGVISTVDEKVKDMSKTVPGAFSNMFANSESPINQMVGKIQQIVDAINALKDAATGLSGVGTTSGTGGTGTGITTGTGNTESGKTGDKTGLLKNSTTLSNTPKTDSGLQSMSIGTVYISKDVDVKNFFKEAERRGYNPRGRM